MAATDAAAKLASLLMESSNRDGSTQKAKVAPKKAVAKKRRSSGKGPAPRSLTKITPNHRRFAEFLLVHNYDPIPAYMDAYSCTRNAAAVSAPKLLIDPLFMAYRDSIQMPMLVSIDADKAFLTQQFYNIAKANVMHYFEYVDDKDGGDQLKLKRLDRLAEWKQQNIKKVKIKNRFIGHGEDREMVQEIELELYDRAAHIHKLALALGIYADLEKNAGEMVEKLIAAEQRNLTWAHDERVRRLGAGEMKEVDGVLVIEQDDEAAT